MSRITVQALAYNHKGSNALLITSPKTGNTIVLYEKWFDKTIDLMWMRTCREHEINQQHNYAISGIPTKEVPVAFSSEDLHRYWRLYKIQQKARKKRLIPRK